ncbi:Histone acetyltransferase MCC1 [Forsythia ovata]|uniref:histone acetyltransferase n=1 Tax=Forsythia ovata TaxID=205694 RepID=A0ABD1XDA8_9LAMI
MVNLKDPRRPMISYRRVQPSDLEVLEKIHGDLFPIRYESEFFQNVVNGRDIMSWGAVDCSRPNEKSDELIGFVTARFVLATESELAQQDEAYIFLLDLLRKLYLNNGVWKCDKDHFDTS